MTCFHIAGVTCDNCKVLTYTTTSDGTFPKDVQNPSHTFFRTSTKGTDYSKNTMCELDDCACCVQGYEQGRKDAIDEILFLIRNSKPFSDKVFDVLTMADWLEGKLKGDR